MNELLGFDPFAVDWHAYLRAARDWLLPRLGQSLLQLLLVGVVWLLARWLLRRVENKVTARTKTHLDDVLMMMATRCVLLSVAFWGIWRLAAVWGQPNAQRVVVTVWIVAFSLPVSRFLIDLLKVFENRRMAHSPMPIDDTALPWVNRAVQVMVIGAAVMMGLHEIGINITPLLAGASVAGLAVSLAARDALANAIAGILLVLDRPFQVGDRIELWGTPVEQAPWGDVTEIGLRATKIRTPDNITVIIPNSIIMQRDIVNWTAGDPTVRLRIPVGIAYDAPSEKAKAIMVQVASESPEVLQEPPPVAIIRRFGDSSVNLELRVWLRDARQRRAVEDWITDRLKAAFDREGIEIPYPKRDLYIKSAPESMLRSGEGARSS